jgi:hypothetical protein
VVNSFRTRPAGTLRLNASELLIQIVV